MLPYLFVVQGTSTHVHFTWGNQIVKRGLLGPKCQYSRKNTGWKKSTKCTGGTDKSPINVTGTKVGTEKACLAGKTDSWNLDSVTLRLHQVTAWSLALSVQKYINKVTNNASSYLQPRNGHQNSVFSATWKYLGTWQPFKPLMLTTKVLIKWLLFTLVVLRVQSVSEHPTGRPARIRYFFSSSIRVYLSIGNETNHLCILKIFYRLHATSPWS